MLEALLRIRPKDRGEFQQNIPQALRFNTDAGQASEYLDQVLEIIARIDPT
jgi:hypothetical protein